jgi:hypothetical protein
MLMDATQAKFIKKGELLNLVEERSEKIMIYVELKVYVGRTAYLEADIFYKYVHDMLISTIEEYRQQHRIYDAIAIVLIDNCSIHLNLATIQLLTDANVKIITFPSHTSEIFQMMDLVCFGIFKQTKRRLCKVPLVHCMEDHAQRIFRVFKAARANSNVHNCFKHAGFTYVKDKHGMYTREFNERKVRSSPEFKEV